MKLQLATSLVRRVGRLNIGGLSYRPQEVRGISSVQRFVVAILGVFATLSVGIWAWYGLGFTTDMYWSAFGTGVAVVVIAVSYTALIARMGVPASKTWTLPEGVTVTIDASAELALARLRAVAGSTSSRLEVEPDEDGVTVIKPSTMLGRSSVRVTALEANGTTELRMHVVPTRFINNGIARGVLYRLETGLARV